MRRRNIGTILTWIMVLSVAVPAAAQTPPPPRTVDFDQAVQQAIAKNPTLAGAQTAIDRAQALLQQARAALMPVVSGSVTSVTYDSERGFEDTVTQPRSQVLFGVDATLPLFVAEERARVNQARDQIDVATLATAETRQQIARAAAQAYLSVVTARRQVEVNQRALEAAQAHLTYAEQRFQGGAGSRLNQLRAAQEASRNEALLENATLALRQTQEALGVLLADDGPVDAGVDPVFDVPLGDDVTQAIADRPDVQLVTRSVEAADRVFRDSWKTWLPRLSASFTPQAVAPASVFAPNASWQLSFNVTQRIFDRRPAAEKALRQVALAEERFAQQGVEIRARSEVRLAQQAVQSYERALGAARLASEQAAEVLRITTSAFEVGATTNLEVIDAQRTARDAETAVALAEDAVRRARLDLLVATGRFK